MNAKPSFRPVPCHGGWQIVVTWPDARTEQLIGYSSEAEAVKWINNLSDRWAVKALAKTRPGVAPSLEEHSFSYWLFGLRQYLDRRRTGSFCPDGQITSAF